MKLNFYDIDKEYTEYLRKYDEKIPYMEYKDRNKFLCGVVLTVNNINYYVPVSSNKNKYLSSFLIYDERSDGTKIATSSLRFSFMFPCPIETITIKDIKSETDRKYRQLTQKEYEYCNKHIESIKKQALKIYNLSKNELLREKYNLCNFQILEEKYKEYVNRKEINNEIVEQNERVLNILPYLQNISSVMDLHYIYEKLDNKYFFEDAVLQLDSILIEQNIVIQNMSKDEINSIVNIELENEDDEYEKNDCEEDIDI